MSTDMLLPATTLGGRIGQARRFTGLTQRQLASKAGVSLRTYQNWERDDAEASITGLRRISAATGFPLLWLIEGAETAGAVREFGCIYDPAPDQLALLERDDRGRFVPADLDHLDEAA